MMKSADERQAPIATNLRAVRERIAAAAQRAGRSPDGVTLAAVTKTLPADTVALALEAGVRTVGENRVQEAEEKVPSLRARFPAAEWHLIGHLQRNKARRAAELFDVFESVDSVRLASTLDRIAAQSGKRMPILLEVNVSGESSKHGFSIPELRDGIESILALSHVHVLGLMTIAPLVPNPDDIRFVFRGLRELRDELAARYTESDFRTLSMGMSDDFEVAIEEGATLVRLGRAIFGPRS